MLIMQNIENHQRHVKTLWVTIITVVVLLIIGMVITFFVAQSPLRQARSQSIAAVEKRHHVSGINHFYFSDLNHVYYTVEGKQNGHQTDFILNQHHRLVKTVRVNNGVDAGYVANWVEGHDHPRKITRVAPSVLNGRAVWIVSYENRRGRLCYRTFKFKTGRSIQLITNL